MEKYTVWVQEANGHGTTHIDSYLAANAEDAAAQAMELVMADWGMQHRRSLRILGIARGDIELVEWNDVA